MKAVKALCLPIREVARAIENKDVHRLQTLKGIGQRTAQKIVATLEGRMGKFALIRANEPATPPVVEDFSNQVLDVLVNQLGHKTTDAKQMIKQALQRNSAIASPEELFEEVYRGEAGR